MEVISRTSFDVSEGPVGIEDKAYRDLHFLKNNPKMSADPF